MNLIVNNLSNDLAKNNAVYLSSALAKDPSKTVNVRINGKIMKCGFLQTLEKNKISMSKNLRNFFNTDIQKTVKVQPFDPSLDQQNGLSFIELQLNQTTPKLTVKTKVQDYTIIEALRQKEKQSFFNLQQTKYLTVSGILYSLTVTKCMIMLTGNNEKKENNFGKMLSETQIQIKALPQSLISLQSTQKNQSNIFRPDFTIEDMGIGGLDEQLFNIFRRTFASRRYSSATINRFGIKHVKGILLYGPPGTGKTLIARQLAKALNVKDLKIVNGPQIFSKFVGQSQQNIRKLFLQARNDQNKLGDKSPLHIIVFDQIDAICKQRGASSGVGGQVSDQVVNQLLTNIDGVQALNNIIVIGMTNRKDLLDQAILRPGRFQVHIQINLPTAQGRLQILKIHTKNLRSNNLLDENIKLEELASLTKNFTGAQIQALVKCASSHSISRTTNILDFSKELIINQKTLKVEMQDFLKALQQVKPQFGVDQQKFGTYFRQKTINYGSSFDKIMTSLQQTTIINQNSANQKRSVLLYGKPGTGKTTFAINFSRHTSFSYLKIISPQNLIGMTESEKIRNISKIFEDAYKTTNACIIIDNLQRLIDFSQVGRRFSNNILQTLLLLLDKTPAKENCKLLIIGTTSYYYYLQQLDLGARFDIKIQVNPLGKQEIQSFLKQKYQLNEAISKKISNLIQNSSVQQVMQLADLVDNKGSYQQWQFYWQNLLNTNAQLEEIQ